MNDNKSQIIIKGIKNNITPDHKYFNLMRYPGYLDELPIEKNTILLESQQGLDIDGNIYHILKELATSDKYSDYKICLVGRGRKVIGKIERRLESLGCRSRCKIIKMWSREYFRTVATAEYLINDNTFASFFIKKDGQTYLNVWHGTPLKTLGRRDKEHAYTIGNVQKNFFMADYMLFPNEFTRDSIIRDYMIENLSKAKILLSGYPRNSALAEGAASEIKSSAGKKVYVYLPTWRGYNVNSEMSEALAKFDKQLTDSEVLYVKLHPVQADRMKLSSMKHIRRFPDDIELYDFLADTDALITDYSSVMFDYAISGKPVVLFTFDEEEYLESRGLYMSLDELPFVRTDNVSMLINTIRCGESVADEAFVNRFCRYDSADSTRKLLERVILGNDTGISETQMPDNGLPSVLIYSGDLSRNGVTASLKALLNEVDTDKKNYYLTFDSSTVYYNRDILETFPENIKYIAIVGKMDADLGEKIGIIGYEFRWMGFERFLKRTEAAYRREIRRLYYDNRFESVVQFSGYSYKKMLLFLQFDSKSTIFVHSDMMREIETRDNQRLEALEYSYDRYDNIIAVSEASRESTETLIMNSDISDDNISKIKVINNCVNLKDIDAKCDLPAEFIESTRSNIDEDRLRKILESDTDIFVNVGRFSKEKRHDRLLDAFEIYHKENPESFLIIIGGNQMNNIFEDLLYSKLKSLKCRDNVVLILRMDNPYSVMKRADGFILSSMYEGFGIVLMEADYLGVPIVCTDIEGPKRFIEENNGTLVESSVDGLVKGLRLLGQRRIKAFDIDYARYNRNNAEKFEATI